jgi:hypothetical protein
MRRGRMNQKKVKPIYVASPPSTFDVSTDRSNRRSQQAQCCFKGRPRRLVIGSPLSSCSRMRRGTITSPKGEVYHSTISAHIDLVLIVAEPKLIKILWKPDHARRALPERSEGEWDLVARIARSTGFQTANLDVRFAPNMRRRPDVVEPLRCASNGNL